MSASTSEWAVAALGACLASIWPPDRRASRHAGADAAAGSGDGARPDGPLDYDVLFEMLSNERRRWVVRYLHETQSTVTLGRIAERLAATENDCIVSGINSRQRKRTYIALYQCHLPKMADAGLVEYDSARGTIAPGPQLDTAHAYLAAPAGLGARAPFAYIVAPAAVGISALLLASSNVAGLVPAGVALCLTLGTMVALTRLDSPGT